MVEAGSAKVPVGTPIATIVHTEEDIALYQGAQETPGTVRVLNYRHSLSEFVFMAYMASEID